MKQAGTGNNRILRLIGSWTAGILLALLFAGGTSAPVWGESVTDTITVKIGYYYMDEEDYVEKATYHWSDLDGEYGGALPTEYQAYSYFQGKDDGVYRTVLVSARGFYLRDLLQYAGVDMSDVEGVSFYTLDHARGAFTSFSYSQLFSEPRYCFVDLPSKIINEYNKAGKIIGFSLDETVWDDKVRVETMLALESKWSTYDAGTEHAEPSYEGMGAGTRFRLLFGQNDPTEERTSQSAKYVHTVAVIVPGSPEIKKGGNASGSSASGLSGSGQIKLSKKIGRHTISFHVAADEAMLDSILNNLQWESTDETVLKIGDIRMTPSGQYADAVEVEIDYEVLKDGEATISGSYLGMNLSGKSLATASDADEKENAYLGPDDPKPADTDPTEAAAPTETKQTASSTKGKNKTSYGSVNKTKETKNRTGDATKENKLSLVSSGGTVTARNTADQAAPAAEPSSAMVSMDLKDIFDPEKKTQITQKDDAKPYIPYICSGLGGVLILGGATSALQFQSQMGTLNIRLRRRG